MRSDFILLGFLLLFTTSLLAQETVDEFIEEGIQYHDKGEYDNAIKAYKKALKLDPSSTLANYEISLSYFNKGDLDRSIEYADKVLDQKGGLMIQAYLSKGSALDMKGETKESIKLFKKAIAQTEGHYLLNYNLALNYYQIGQFKDAEKNTVAAIELNSYHPSSHLLLAKINNDQGNSSKTLLAAHYFLFLEPNSSRSSEAYTMLLHTMGANVSQDPEDPNTININFSPDGDDEFRAADLMVAMLEASKALEKNEGKSDDELFIENTTSFFTVLGELNEGDKKDIWWNFYTPFFYGLAQSAFMEAYCMYIGQSGNERASEWLNENEEVLGVFNAWLSDE